MERKWYHFPLMGLTFLISWVYLLTLLPIFNLFANGYWLIVILYNGRLKELIRLKRKIARSITNIKTFVFEYSDFEYKFDGFIPNAHIAREDLKWYHMWPTWVPLIIVYLYRGRKDNCDGSEKVCRWMYKALLKNHKSYKGKIKYHKVIYVPYIPFKQDKTHYFAVLEFGDCEIFHNKEHICFSVGKVTDESKDDLAFRYLRGDSRYIWIRW